MGCLLTCLPVIIRHYSKGASTVISCQIGLIFTSKGHVPARPNALITYSVIIHHTLMSFSPLWSNLALSAVRRTAAGISPHTRKMKESAAVEGPCAVFFMSFYSDGDGWGVVRRNYVHYWCSNNNLSTRGALTVCTWLHLFIHECHHLLLSPFSSPVIKYLSLLDLVGWVRVVKPEVVLTSCLGWPKSGIINWSPQLNCFFLISY